MQIRRRMEGNLHRALCHILKKGLGLSWLSFEKESLQNFKGRYKVQIALQRSIVQHFPPRLSSMTGFHGGGI